MKMILQKERTVMNESKMRRRVEGVFIIFGGGPCSGPPDRYRCKRNVVDPATQGRIHGFNAWRQVDPRAKNEKEREEKREKEKRTKIGVGRKRRIMAETEKSGCHIGAVFPGLDWASTRRERGMYTTTTIKKRWTWYTSGTERSKLCRKMELI